MVAQFRFFRFGFLLSHIFFLVCLFFRLACSHNHHADRYNLSREFNENIMNSLSMRYIYKNVLLFAHSVRIWIPESTIKVPFLCFGLVKTRRDYEITAIRWQCWRFDIGRAHQMTIKFKLNENETEIQSWPCFRLP